MLQGERKRILLEENGATNEGWVASLFIGLKTRKARLVLPCGGLAAKCFQLPSVQVSAIFYFFA